MSGASGLRPHYHGAAGDGGALSGAVRDLLSGNDSLFSATIGNWTASGGSVAWDSSSTYTVPGGTGTLKFTTSAAGQYVEVAVPGTFLAGRMYDAFAWVMVQENSFGVADQLQLVLGQQGVDTAASITNAVLSAGAFFVNANGYFFPLYVRWRPAADTSTVKLRLTRAVTSGATTIHVHIGLARVADVLSTNGVGLGIVTGGESADQTLYVNAPFLALGGWSGFLAQDATGTTLWSPAFGFSVKLSESGIILGGVPSADPHVVGAVWNSTGTLKISAG